MKTILTFWTFDLFHKGHEHYLSEAKTIEGKLITIIARDETVKRVKWFYPEQNEQKRKALVIQSGIPDEVYLWDPASPLHTLGKYQPDVLFLGYDQRSFPDIIENYIAENTVEVIRWESYQPETYKSSKLRKSNSKN